MDAAPKEACDKIDFLFVIDNSLSMEQEQRNLGMNFPDFISVIHDYDTEAGDEIDYRVAITTTARSMIIDTPGTGTPWDVNGEDGAFLSECGMTRPWIERGDPDITDTFGCVANVGTAGPVFEMPLLVIDWALQDRMLDGTNQGFLRDDALLAIVILTDEDDCSQGDDLISIYYECPASDLFPVSDYPAIIDSVKSQRERWALAVIAGPGPGECESEFGIAQEATRLREFVDLTGDNAVFGSICEGDLSSPLADAIQTFTEACEQLPDID